MGPRVKIIPYNNYFVKYYFYFFAMFIYFLGYLLYNIILYEVKTMNNYIIPKPKLILNWIIFFISLLFLSFGIISNSKSLHYQILGTKTEARILRVVNTTDDSLAKIRYKCGFLR